MEAKRMLVSIVTIARNSRDFVEGTIRSVIGQDYPHIEYIIVDGASTDGTVDIIRKYESNISKFISEPDDGIADAFNKGFRSSTGEYVLFLNSDDRLASPSAVGSMVDAIVKAGGPDLIYGDCDLIDRQSGQGLYRASIEFCPGAFRRGRTLPHPSLFTSRGYFNRYGTFDTQFRIAMDYEFLLRGALQSRIVHVPIVVTEVRTGGISTNSPAVIPEIVRALRKNKIIRTSFGAWVLRGYFQLRGVGRGVRRLFFRSRSAQRRRAS